MVSLKIKKNNKWKTILIDSIPILGDVQTKLRLAFDMYDMNKDGKVI